MITGWCTSKVVDIAGTRRHATLGGGDGLHSCHPRVGQKLAVLPPSSRLTQLPTRCGMLLTMYSCPTALVTCGPALEVLGILAPDLYLLDVSSYELFSPTCSDMGSLGACCWWAPVLGELVLCYTQTLQDARCDLKVSVLLQSLILAGFSTAQRKHDELRLLQLLVLAILFGVVNHQLHVYASMPPSRGSATLDTDFILIFGRLFSSFSTYLIQLNWLQRAFALLALDRSGTLSTRQVQHCY